jgi:Tfp pilus assembly protein PilN
LESVIKVSARLNLASQPFRNRALPWAVTALVVFLSLVALALIASASNSTNTQAAAVEVDAKKLSEQNAQLQRQAEQLRKALGPDELLQLNSAQGLVDRKRFSWTRLFSDLEGALPGNVRVTRISVRDVASRGDRTSADLDMTVIGKSPDDVTEMIADMDRSGVFRAFPLAENLQKGRGETGTEWTLNVQYTPRAGVSTSNGDRSKGSSELTASNSGAEVRK